MRESTRGTVAVITVLSISAVGLYVAASGHLSYGRAGFWIGLAWIVSAMWLGRMYSAEYWRSLRVPIPRLGNAAPYPPEFPPLVNTLQTAGSILAVAGIALQIWG